MDHRPARIFLSAGEPSGDLHGARLVEALRARLPGAVIEAFGGPRMAAAGAKVLYPMERYTAFGLAEVIGKIPAHLRLLRQVEAQLAGRMYDLVIPIDYPGFNLRLATAARRHTVRVLYYIVPQLWAWHRSRINVLRRTVDLLAVILPFEERFYRDLGVDAAYVGNPLLDRTWPSRASARDGLGLPPDSRVLGIFPGSRGQEVRALWPAFRDTARRMLDEGRCTHAVVAATPAGQYPDPGPLLLHHGDPVPVFAAADAALAKSGTTTLECALADVPMVMAYRVHPLTWIIGRRLTDVPWFSLVNLIAEREVVPEILQGRVTVDELASGVGPLLDPASPARAAQLAGLADVRRRLGGPGAAARVADAAARLLDR
ncbi:MAG TPA: lipid-A-disaccharide synthase [Gemmatimonadales bacterium]|nr:lipid-A-disaccharide synthase [Gemmatimonadales bacterium]